MTPGVQGACPRPSFSPFLGRNGDPRRAGGAPGALRPKGSFGAAHPEGTYWAYSSTTRGTSGRLNSRKQGNWFPSPRETTIWP